MSKNDLTIMPSGNQETMSSSSLAEMLGKAKNHVNRDIKNMFQDKIDGVIIGSLLDSRGYVVEYYLPELESKMFVAKRDINYLEKIVQFWIDKNKPQIPANFSEALQLAADQAKQLELQAPKVEFADTIIESKGSVSIGEFAKIHGEYGRNIMFKILRGEGILMKDNVPYQKYVSEGYFELTEKDTPVGIKAVTRITGKGQAWLTMRLNKLKDN